MNRPQYNLTDETATIFKLRRCTDESCAETDNNVIAPMIHDDPIVWFKAEAVTADRYVHIRECQFGFEGFRADNTSDPVDYTVFAVDGCIWEGLDGWGLPLFPHQDKVRQVTKGNETSSRAFDKFSFLLSDMGEGVLTFRCILNACLPPSQGEAAKYCDIHAQCPGRYDDIWASFAGEAAEIEKWSRDDDVHKDAAIVDFDVMHPCAFIRLNPNQTKYCPTGDESDGCWYIENNQCQRQAAASSKTTALVCSYTGIILLSLVNLYHFICRNIK